MSQFLPSLIPALDSNGDPVPSAVWEFYRKGTTTPAALWGGATAVTADENGSFSDIVLNENINYRARLVSSTGKVIYDISSEDSSFFDAAVKSAVDTSGDTLSGAVWSFYTTGTTNLQTVYADFERLVPLGAHVTANSVGQFPEIYLDPEVTYKAVLSFNGVVSETIDPVTKDNIGSFFSESYLPPLEPSEDWDGSAGSGFSSTPTDPTRTTAKPALKLIVPHSQRFTDELVVGVLAFANNEGTLVGGITTVRYYFEGSTREVSEPTLRTFARYDGTTYNCLGYWINLGKPSGTAGEAHLYVEAVPADTTMQNRVIGPYSFYPADTLYDEEITVTPSAPAVTGSNYQTLATALERHRSNTNDATKIVVTEDLTEDITALTGSNYEGNGHCVVETASGVTLTLAKTTYVNDGSTDIRPKIGGIWFKGPNIVCDMQNQSEFYTETTLNGYVFERCRLINSGGRAHLWRAGGRPVAHLVRARGVFLECEFDALPDIGVSSDLVRGCIGTDLYRDFIQGGGCAIYNKITSLDATKDWAKDVNAFTVTYTGTETTATLALSGGNDANSRTFTAVWGANSDTFVVGKTEALYIAANDGAYDATTDGQGYFNQNVVDWLNSLTGWTAVLQDNTRRASAASLANLKGTAFTARSVKDTVLQIVTCFDMHGDLFQQGALLENAIVAFNSGTEMVGQNIFVGNVTTAPKDFVFVGNTLANDLEATGYGSVTQLNSQLQRNTASHVVVVHNTMANQEFRFRYDNGLIPDAYCLFANNCNTALLNVGTVTGSMVVANNAIDEGKTAPSNATGTVIAGDYTSKFVDSVAGDFTPTGELLENLKTPVFERDINGTVYTEPGVIGAVAS